MIITILLDINSIFAIECDDFQTFLQNNNINSYFEHDCGEISIGINSINVSKNKGTGRYEIYAYTNDNPTPKKRTYPMRSNVTMNCNPKQYKERLLNNDTIYIERNCGNSTVPMKIYYDEGTIDYDKIIADIKGASDYSSVGKFSGGEIFLFVSIVPVALLILVMFLIFKKYFKK